MEKGQGLLTAGRLTGLDALRGFVLLQMLAYHFLYDLVRLFGWQIGWFWALPGVVWQQCICSGFILLSGWCCRVSRSNLKRGLQLLGLGLLLTVITGAVMPGQIIRFGVLHFLGCAALIWAAAGRWLDRLPAPLLFFGSLALFLLTTGTQWGYWGLWRLPLLQLPAALYQSRWLFFLGLPGPGFYSADYFPLLPWCFVHWMGAAAQRMVPASGGWGRLLRLRAPLLEALGRNSLLIYLLHQPVLYALAWALSAACG